MQHDIGFAIHDTGGTDTIDFSGSTQYDPRLARRSVSSVNGHSNNVSIFAGTMRMDRLLHRERHRQQFRRHSDRQSRRQHARWPRRWRPHGRNGGDDTYFVIHLTISFVRRPTAGNEHRHPPVQEPENQENRQRENIIYADESTTQPGGRRRLPAQRSADNTMTSIIFGGSETIPSTEAPRRHDLWSGGDDLIIGARDSLASRDINNTIDVEDLEDQTESDDGNDTLYGGPATTRSSAARANDISTAAPATIR